MPQKQSMLTWRRSGAFTTLIEISGLMRIGRCKACPICKSKIKIQYAFAGQNRKEMGYRGK